MSFRFFVISNPLTRTFMKKMKGKKKCKTSTNTSTTTTTTTTTTSLEQPVPSSSSMTTKERCNDDDDDDDDDVKDCNDSDGLLPTINLLPYSQYVTLSDDEMKFNCQIRVAAHEVQYTMVTTVIDSWERDVITIPKWNTIYGEVLLRKMFELEPDCIPMFGFPTDTRYNDPALSTNTKFMNRGTALLNTIDIALSMLGPDLEPLEKQLVDMGKRHVGRGCKPKHWPMVGVALFYTLERALGEEKFTTHIQNCWIVLYNFLGYHMIQGLIENGGPTWEDN